MIHKYKYNGGVSILTMAYRDRVDLQPRFARFFRHLRDYTDVDEAGIAEIMAGGHVVVSDDGGRFYKLMCHDILLCERKRQRDTDTECNTCDNIDKVYYEKASYGKGSSHRGWRDDEYPQYRLGKGSLPNLAGRGNSDHFDFLIGLRTGNSWFQFEKERGENTISGRDDLLKLDTESTFRKTYKMSTWGHLKSTFAYGLSGRNQGPFGSSAYNDSNPLRLKLVKAGMTKANRFFAPITEKDSVLYGGETNCEGV